jgi:hypothetical protein
MALFIEEYEHFYVIKDTNAIKNDYFVGLSRPLRPKG